MTFDDGFRPVRKDSVAQENPPNSWAESLGELSLPEARTRVKDYRKQRHRSGGAWSPASAWPADFFARTKVVGVFKGESAWDEPASLPLPASVRRAYPRLNRDHLEFCVVDENELVPHSQFRLLEPPASASPVEPDLLLVPALLADRQGHRIGRGGGYYDRYLSARPALPTVAVLRSDYVLNDLPNHWLHAGDRPVGALLTESYFHSIQTRRNSP